MWATASLFSSLLRFSLLNALLTTTLPGYGPDANGQFHPLAVKALEYAGRWLETNGQSIYYTRPMIAAGSSGPSLYLGTPEYPFVWITGVLNG